MPSSSGLLLLNEAGPYPAYALAPRARIFDATSAVRPQGWTIGRTTAATYFNSAKLLATAAVGAERIDYSPVTGALLGLLIEPGSSSIVTPNTNLTSSPWAGSGVTISAVPGLDGAATSGLNIAGTSAYSYQANNQVPFAANTTYTASIHIAKTNGAPFLTAFSVSPDSEYGVACNTDAGTVVRTTFGAPASSFGIVDAGAWWRVWETFTVGGSGTASGIFWLEPPVCDSGGNRADRTGNGSTSYSYPQIEPGTAPTSVIPASAAGPVARAADAYSFTLAPDAAGLIFTFDDGSQQTITGLTGGATYTIPTNLNRSRIRYIDDVAALAPRARVFNAATGTRPASWAVGRTSAATYFSNTGVLSTAAAGAERIDYSPSNNALLGLLIEPASSTSILGPNSNCVAAPWAAINGGTVVAAPGVDGSSTSGFTVSGTSAAACNSYTLNIPAGPPAITVSAYVNKTVNAPFLSGIAIYSLNNSGTNRGVVINTDTGALLPMTFDGGAAPSAYQSFDAGTRWFVVFTMALNGLNQTNPLALFYAPTFDNTGARAARSNNGSVTYSSPQIEVSGAASSFIPNATTAQVSRAVDVYSFSLASDAKALIFTFDDGSTQTIPGLTGGSTYTIPTSLNRSRVMYIDDSTGPAGGGGSTGSSTDTGTGTDVATAAAAAAQSTTDTGAGADTASGRAAVTASTTDTGAGADTVTATVSQSGSTNDTGTGSETGTAITSVIAQATDVGAGSDQPTATLAAQAAATDTGTASDAATARAATQAALADAGAGQDASTAAAGAQAATQDAGAASDAPSASAAALATLADAGVGTDAASARAAVTVSLSDTGTGSDAASASSANTAVLSDTGTGVDTPAAAASVPAQATDTGAGSDTSTAQVAATLALSDTGAGTDSQSAQVAGTQSTADMGAGTDAASARAGVTVSVSDVGAGTDAALGSSANTASLLDTGTGTDAASARGQVTVALADTGTGTDAVSATAAFQVSLSDTGAGQDATSATAQVAPVLSDAGVGSDAVTASVANVGSAQDVGTGSDAISVVVNINVAVNDNGTGQDAIQVAVQDYAEVQDVGAGSDQSTVAVHVVVSVADAGTGQDAAIGFYADPAFLKDLGTGTDRATVTVQLPRAQVQQSGAYPAQVTQSGAYPADVDQSGAYPDRVLQTGSYG